MATLPAPHPRLAQHLSDHALTPLLSSATSNTPQLAALAALGTASISAYESAQKLGLGLPQRIIVETARDGPLVLHSCLTPPSSNPLSPELDSPVAGATAILAGDCGVFAREALRSVSAPKEERFGHIAEVTSVQSDDGHFIGEEVGINEQGLLSNVLDKGKEQAQGMALPAKADEVQLAPLLVATVVAPGHELVGEARKLVVRLERIGVEFQKTWVKEKDVERNDIKGDEETGG